mgnify:CR=1 FL=1
MLKKPFGQVAVAYLVEHIEGIDQQTFVLGRRVGDGVDVRCVFGSIAAFEAYRGIDTDAACVEGRSELEIDESAVLHTVLSVIALSHERLHGVQNVCHLSCHQRTSSSDCKGCAPTEGAHWRGDRPARKVRSAITATWLA